MVSRPLMVVVPGFPWREHFLEPCGGDNDFNMFIAWTFLADRPHVGRPADHVSTSTFILTKAPTSVPYKMLHTLHTENEIRVDVLASKCF
jgi:hypothetical protein